MTTETAAQSELLFDARWEAWIAKGVKHDRAARKRALMVAAVVVAGLATWLTALTFGAVGV
jgi:hypothetical protein